MRITHNVHPDVAEVTLSEDELSVITALIDEEFPKLAGMPEARAVCSMLDTGSQLWEELPELTALLDKFKTHRSYKVLVIHTPVPTNEEIGDTPDRYLGPDENKLLRPDLYRGFILGLAGWYGYGYTSQQNGVIHNNVIASLEHYGRVGISANPMDELGLHTEDASYNLGGRLNISPDFLTLHFLRNPDAVPSVISLPDWRELLPTHQEILRTEFYFNHTNPGQGGDTNATFTPVSVLYGPDRNDPWLRINTALMFPDDYRSYQATALKKLGELLNHSALDLPLMPGDIAIIDNLRVPHGRRKYSEAQMPRFDGKDRWQRRLVVVDDASRLDPFEVSPHVVDPSILMRKSSEQAAARKQT